MIVVTGQGEKKEDHQGRKTGRQIEKRIRMRIRIGKRIRTERRTRTGKLIRIQMRIRTEREEQEEALEQETGIQARPGIPTTAAHVETNRKTGTITLEINARQTVRDHRMPTVILPIIVRRKMILHPLKPVEF